MFTCALHNVAVDIAIENITANARDFATAILQRSGPITVIRPCY